MAPDVTLWGIITTVQIVEVALALGRIAVLHVRGERVRHALAGRFGLRAVWNLQMVASLYVVVGWIAGEHPWQVYCLVFNLWLIDDVYFSDDDRDRRRRFLASLRARLRMPKPVPLRPAERWSPDAV